MAALTSEMTLKFTLGQLWGGVVAIVVAVTVGVWVVSRYLSKVETRLAAIEEKTGVAITRNQAELWASDMRYQNAAKGITVLSFKPYEEKP